MRQAMDINIIGCDPDRIVAHLYYTVNSIGPETVSRIVIAETGTIINAQTIYRNEV
jgi:hypothetical protein